VEIQAKRVTTSKITPDGTWMALRRPMLVALVIGCVVSLLDARVLTARLAIPAAFWWTYVPLLEILGLFAASPAARRSGSWQRTIDLFFTGHGPWLLWMVALAAGFAFIPTVRIFSWVPHVRIALDSAVVIVAWSAYIDYQFFRRVLKQSAWRAGRDLLVQRAISWTLGLTIFVGGAGYQMLASRFGL
jgi:hypothetical protein